MVTKLIVVGGDDAKWELMSWALVSVSWMAFTWHAPAGKAGRMAISIRSGRVRRTLGKLKEREGKTAQKARDYVLKRQEKGADWREKVMMR